MTRSKSTGWAGLVYQGRVDLPQDAAKNVGYNYCDYLALGERSKVERT